METWTTEKTCKCGNHMRVHYEHDERRDAIDCGVDEKGYHNVALTSRPKQWPQGVKCLHCGRRHELSSFKKLEVAQ